MKQKTKTALKKRAKVTGSGKIRFKAAGSRHLKSSKSTKTWRGKSNGVDAPKGHVKTLKRMAHGNL